MAYAKSVWRHVRRVINAVFSGLAFAGLLYAILLQKDELALQREELRLTRTELQRSATAQEASEKALALQARSSELTAKLTAINYLLDHVNQEIREKFPGGYVVGSPEEKKFKALAARRDVLLQLLEQVFADVNVAKLVKPSSAPDTTG